MQRSQTVASGPVPAWTHAPGHKKKGLPRNESGPGNNNSSNSKSDGIHASQNVAKPGRSRKHSGGPPGMQGGSALSGSLAHASNGHSSASAKSRTSQESRRQRTLSSNGYQGSGQQQTGHFGGRSKQGKQADAANTAARAKNLDPSLIQSLHQMVRSGGTSLDLSRRDFGPEHVHVLAEALKGNRSVSKLNLSHNPIGDQGCELLADALRFNSGLKEIDLSFTESTGNGVRALCKKLKESKWLKARVRKLNLAGNRHGARGPTAIYRTLSFASSLRELTLDRMNHEGAERLASALASNQTPLARLALLHCDLDEAFAGSVAKIVQEHASLRALTVGNFPQSPAADAAIDKADMVVMVEAAATTRMGSLDQLLQPLASGASRLEELTLCSLVVTERELELLGRALAGDRHLKRLALEDALCSATESPQFTQYVQLHPFVQSIEGLVLVPPRVGNGAQVVPASNQISEHQETTLNRNDAIGGEINSPIRPATAATTMDLHQATPSFVEAAPMNLGWNFAPPPAAVDEAQPSIATSLSRDSSPPDGLIGLPPPGFHAAAVHANAQQGYHEQLPPLMPGLGPGATSHVDAGPAQFAPPGFDPSHWGNIDPHLQEEIMSGFGGLWPANSSSSSSSSSFSSSSSTF